ncbi:MATE family efflux transporter [uncultured Subdoligranulum sp.]|uniref:MATE family efflux transporter n=1 Tax=uncultured Subdoligranulum sp. TaxID=512298 RepID=UPI00344C2AAD
MLNNPVENAAVTLVYPVTLAFNAVNNLFGVGVSSAMSRHLGRKAYDQVRVCSAFGFYGAMISGLLFSALCILFRLPLLTLLGTDAQTLDATAGYLHWTVCCGALPAILNVVQSYMVRSEGSTLHASIGTMSGCLLNIVLDPIFILPWGLNMGAAGAGLATFLSNCVACLYFVVLARIKKGKTFVSMDLRLLPKLTAEQIRDILGVGIPASIQNLLNVTGTTLLNNFTAPFGAAAIAAMGISQKLYMIPMQVSLGFSQGIMPLVSYNYASGNRKRMKQTILFAMRIIVCSVLFLTVVYYLSVPAMIRAFMDSEEIIAYGSRFLRVMSLGFVFLCTDFLAVGVFQALGMGRNALLFAICRKLVLEIPLLFLLNHFYPLYGLPFAQLITEIFLSCLGVIMLRRIFRAEVH